MGLGAQSPGDQKLQTLFGKGALSGKTGLIVQAASTAGISPELFAAVIAHETGLGTSNAIQNYNNPAGIMDPKSKWTKLKKFDSLGEGLLYSAKNLKRRLDQVGGDVDKLADVYAPKGAANDPTGLNNNWLSGVNKFYSELATKPNPVAKPEEENMLQEQGATAR
jgi:hypothetical protein